MPAESSVDALIAADTRLTRSFTVAVAAVLATLGWALFVASPPAAGEVPRAPLVLLIIQLAAYVWYAVSAGSAAALLGANRALYVSWILAAPFLAMIPIPIVSSLIGISPLSIKFLLGGQLQSAIRQASYADLHGSSTAV